MTLNDFGPFDYIVAGIVLLFFLRGLCLGFFRQGAATLALVGSYLLAGEYMHLASPHVQDFIDRPAAVFLLSFVALFLAASLLFGLLGSLLRNVVQFKTVGLADRFVGGFLGVARGVILAVLAYMLLVFILSPQHPLFDNAQSQPYVHEASEIFLRLIGDVDARNDLHSALNPPPVQQEEKQGPVQEEEYQEDVEEPVPQQEILPEAEFFYQPYQQEIRLLPQEQEEYPNTIPVQQRQGWED